jgi:pimeloyl-ACP methyl ester carboxylesterase
MPYDGIGIPSSHLSRSWHLASWFEENDMKPFERTISEITPRRDVIAVDANKHSARRSTASAGRFGIAVLATTATSVPLSTMACAGDESAAIRPFRVDVSEPELVDLRTRALATRWPDQETVADQAQGARLEQLRELVQYWGTGYDWRQAEAKLNALPQFTTNIDGVDIHFIHVRSRHEGALPVIISHGWPGSVFEQIGLIGPLTDPTAFGGQAEDAFDVVIPSLPGFGFSGRPTEVGWGLERTGHAWNVLMERLGYDRYVAQGGDWGAGIVQAMGRQAPPALLGIHTNLPATLPSDVGAALAGGGPAPADLSDDERAAFEVLRSYGASGGTAYVAMMGARPQAPSAMASRTRRSDSRGGCSFTVGSQSGRTAKTPSSGPRWTRYWTTLRCTG